MKQQPGTNRPVWQSEQTYPELSTLLKEGLKMVSDPELNYDVFQLGLVRNVKIDADGVSIEMILTTPFCPYGPAMIEMVREKAEEVLKRPVTIALGMEIWDFSMMEEGLEDDWGLY